LGGVVATLGVGYVPVASWLDSVRKGLIQRVSNLRDYRTLRPLWQALTIVDPSMVHEPASLRERFSIESRLFWRVIEINDWLHQIRAYRTSSLADTQTAQQPETDTAHDNTWATAEAMHIKAALLTKSRGEGIVQTSTTKQSDSPGETTNAFTSELMHLIAIA